MNTSGSPVSLAIQKNYRKKHKILKSIQINGVQRDKLISQSLMEGLSLSSLLSQVAPDPLNGATRSALCVG